jgi:NAD(P)-dependent dehydrogenase (short-subunit alcohol dehydrogenase family)
LSGRISKGLGPPRELAPHDVTVNAVCPTGVETPLIDGIVTAAGQAALTRVSDASGSMNVLDSQLIEPADVTAAVLWLASDAARYVTGTVLPVDAGMTAK